MNDALQILFYKYSNNELSIEDRQAFELRLIEDLDFKTEFKIYNSMNSFIDKNNTYKEALSSLRDFHKESQGLENEPPQRSLNWNYILISLGFLIAALFAYKYLILKPVNPTEIYAQVYEEPNWPLSRGSKSTLEKAIYNFRNDKKQIAFDSLYNSKLISDANKNYWLAELHLFDNQPDSTLLYIKKNTNSTLRDRLIYLELMSHLHKNDTASLNQKLKSLPTNLSSYYQNRVDELIKLLNK